MIPAAAVATIRAAVDDAHRTGHADPADVAQRVADELTAHGWTVTAHEWTKAPQTPTQPIVTAA